jgi:hypothetical protein
LAAAGRRRRRRSGWRCRAEGVEHDGARGQGAEGAPLLGLEVGPQPPVLAPPGPLYSAARPENAFIEPIDGASSGGGNVLYLTRATGSGRMVHAASRSLGRSGDLQTHGSEMKICSRLACNDDRWHL